MTFFIGGKTIEVDENGFVVQVQNFKETLLGTIKDIWKKSLVEISNEVQQMVVNECT